MVAKIKDEIANGRIRSAECLPKEYSHGPTITSRRTQGPVGFLVVNNPACDWIKFNRPPNKRANVAHEQQLEHRASVIEIRQRLRPATEAGVDPLPLVAARVRQAQWPAALLWK